MALMHSHRLLIGRRASKLRYMTFEQGGDTKKIREQALFTRRIVERSNMIQLSFPSTPTTQAYMLKMQLARRKAR